MNCPYCDHKNHLEIDMHADGYSSTLLECSECGALLNLKRTNLETVHGPTVQLQARPE
ncbi:MAG: CPXCG motif-containing cysteine-rich protein [Desulfuromusa sp.]|jgi:transcription elongation factor Elf1|nr:CPXCG motif-containing cysteine-rich protein [Desulfuromusa sp.]